MYLKFSIRIDMTQKKCSGTISDVKFHQESEKHVYIFQKWSLQLEKHCQRVSEDRNVPHTNPQIKYQMISLLSDRPPAKPDAEDIGDAHLAPWKGVFIILFVKSLWSFFDTITCPNPFLDIIFGILVIFYIIYSRTAFLLGSIKSKDLKQIQDRYSTKYQAKGHI